MASFITSYLDATDEKTEATKDSFSSSATVLNPKWVCLSSALVAPAPNVAAGLDEEKALGSELEPLGASLGEKGPVDGRSDLL